MTDPLPFPGNDRPAEVSPEMLRAHAALQRQRRAQTSVAAPTPEELQSLVDGTLSMAEREALLERVFASGAADELALLHSIRILPAPTAASRSLARRFWPVAAAASLVVAVSIPALRLLRTDRTAEPTYRGSDSANGAPQLRAPRAASGGNTFAWSAVPEADRYAVELLNANGEVVTHLDTRDTTITIPDSVSNATNGSLKATSWWVIAQLRGGGQRRSAVVGLVPPAKP